MKLKCPACSQVLNIPDTAAGKVVKCPCGKQLRAPAAKPGGAAAGQRPPGAAGPAPGQATRRPAGAAPASQPTSGFDPSMFDELTDEDMKPVATAGVSAAGGTKKKSVLEKAAADLQQETEANKTNFRAGAAKEVYSSIGILLMLGFFKVAIYGYFFMQAEAEVESVFGAMEEGDEDLEMILMLVKAFYLVNVSIGAIFLLCAALIFKFPMTCAFTAMVTFVISEIIGLILNPFRLLSIGGWVVRCAIFGALIQAINNAAYYKFVKAGGRDKD